MSVFNILIFLAWVFLVGWPLARILERMGFARAYALLAFIPIGNIIALWVLARTPWPAVADTAETFR